MADATSAPTPGAPQTITILNIVRVVTVDLVVLAGRTVLHRGTVISSGVTITVQPGGEFKIL